MMFFSKSKGFSLLEVLVALVIFSLCTAVVVKYTGQSTHFVDTLKRKTQGTVVAELALADFTLKQHWPDTDIYNEQYEQFNTVWLTEIEVTETDIEDIKKIETRVFTEDHEQAITRLHSFIGNPDAL